MISTTLMTFLLTTSPDVRSVKLLGSWDNFSKHYPMERDKRAGPGHWTGCHTFTDIVGDGPPNDKSQWRTRGLKMGATYWYYYLLDDDIESFNESEPVTTQCALMPGQPMNILNVPIVLPDSPSHRRTDSNSSQKSEYRTMNPEDKFMNPRTPPKPSLARTQTATLRRKKSIPAYVSSALPMGGSMMHRSASQPSSAARRDHSSKDARSVSPPRSRGFRAAFRQINEETSQKRPEAVQQSNAQNLALLQGGNVKDGRKNPSATAPPSANTSENSAPATIQSRRAMKTGDSGDSTPRRNPLTVDTRLQERNAGAPRDPVTGKADGSGALNNAGGFVSATSDADKSDASTPTGADLNEKRLPSLPNTPSSVMDEAVRAIDERDKELIAEVPTSHFSSMTVDESMHSRLAGEKSRFSEWSTDTETNSHESGSSAATFNRDKHESPAVDDSWKTPDLSSQPTDTATNTDPNTPHLTVNSKPSSPNSASGDIPPWNVSSLPQLTVSLSSPNADGSGLGIENIDEMVESNPKRHAALFNAIESMQALALARSRSGSPILLPEAQRQSGVESKEGKVQAHPGRDDASLRGQRTMQELMDELSYLKNMIQADMDGSPF